MIFHSDDQSPGRLGAGNEQLLIDRLEGEGIDDANVDAPLTELVGGSQGLVQGHTSTYNSHLVTV